MLKVALIPSLLLMLATVIALSIGQVAAAEETDVTLVSSSFEQLANQESIDC